MKVHLKTMTKFLFFLILLPILCYLYLRWLERASVWIPRREWEALPSVVGLEYEDVVFAAADGVRLSGWYVPAEDALASLLFCHGNGGNISHRTESLRQFHSIRLNVFIFDYRGYGKSEGRLSEAGTYLDAEAAYRWLRRKTPDLPMLLFGRSLGSAVAVDLALKVEADALICESGFTCIPDMAREVFPWLPTRTLCALEYDALSKIPNVKMPVLIVHSPEDEVVPHSHSEKLFAAAPEPKFRIRLQGGHNEGYILSETEYLRDVELFVERQILHRSSPETIGERGGETTEAVRSQP